MLQKIKSFLFENKTTRQTVAKNTFWLSVANFGGRGLKAVIIIYGARILGAAGYGVFSYATTLAGFFTLFIDPGVNTLIMREIPKADEEHRQAFLSTSFFLKSAFIVIVALFVLFVAPFFSTLPGAKALLPIVAVIIAADGLREFFSAFIRAREKMEREAGIFLLTVALIVIAGFIFLHYSPTPLAFAWAYSLGSVIGALFAIWTLRHEISGIFTRFSRALVAPIVKAAWPFAVTGALGLLLTNSDILIISWLKTATDVGIYSAAIRVVQTLYIVPVIVQYSTLPVIARLANRDNAAVKNIFERAVTGIFMISVPLALGGAIIGTNIMQFLYGAAYAAGGLSFKILMLTMLFDFPITLVAATLFAYDRQKSLIVASAIGGILNVGLDLLLIPKFGIAGSAVATLIAQAASSSYLWIKMKQVNPFSIFPYLKKIMIASICMAGAAFALLALHIHVIAIVICSLLLYGLLLYILHEPLFQKMRGLL